MSWKKIISCAFDHSPPPDAPESHHGNDDEEQLRLTAPSRTHTNVPSLPDTIWFRIFMHLPVEDLQTLKLVCTGWWKGITSKEFQAAYVHAGGCLSSISRGRRCGVISLVELTVTDPSPRSRMLSFLRRRATRSVKCISLLNFELNNASMLNNNTIDIGVQCHGLGLESLVKHIIGRHGMKPYSKSYRLQISILGSCDGILLTAILGYYIPEDAVDPLLVINPVTKCYNLIPFWKSSARPVMWYETGWSIVRSHCEDVGRYKVIGLHSYFDRIECHICEFDIDQLQERMMFDRSSWKELRFPPTSYSFVMKANLYANGKLYWLSRTHRKYESGMVSLDVATEEFDVIPCFLMPYSEGLDGGRPCDIEPIGSGHGMFYQMHIVNREGYPTRAELWVINDFTSIPFPGWTMLRRVTVPEAITGRQLWELQLVAVLDGGNYLVTRIVWMERIRRRTLVYSWPTIYACDVRANEWREIGADSDLRVKRLIEGYYNHHANSLFCWK